MVTIENSGVAEEATPTGSKVDGSVPKTMPKTKSKDPEDPTQGVRDGGWGWFVCLGSSLIVLSLRSLEPSFGLLFRDILDDLKIDSTGTSLIMSVYDVNINFSGFFLGPLLKRFTYRKAALFGALVSCSGLILTSAANSMTYIICTYSILAGSGTGLAVSSSFVALNTFFDKKRGQAFGFSMAGNSLAMMLGPQIIHFLLDYYGFNGTMLIVGACAMHSVVGACLLFPPDIGKPKLKAIPAKTENDAFLNDTKSNAAKRLDKKENEVNNNHNNNNNNVMEAVTDFKKPARSLTSKIRKAFDLDLLKDSIYVNAILGLGFFYVAETNFKLLTPFFLTDIGMTNGEVASCLSITAFADIFSRLILPTIFDKLKFKKRHILWTFLLLVGIARSALAEQSKGTYLIVTLGIIGFLRGVTIVNAVLTVPECCSLKQLPCAYGIYMMVKGIFVLAMSPLIGYIRDTTGSYAICIHVVTLLTIMTFVMWSLEFLYIGLRNRRTRLAKKAQAENLE